MKIILVTDTHFGEGSIPTMQSQTSELTRQLQREVADADLLIHGGDIVIGSRSTQPLAWTEQWDFAKKWLTSLRTCLPQGKKLPLFMVPGNHDIESSAANAFDYGGFEEVAQDFTDARQADQISPSHNPLEYSFEIQLCEFGIRLLLLQSFASGNGSGVIGRPPGWAEMTNRSQQLIETSDDETPTIIVSHVPIKSAVWQVTDERHSNSYRHTPENEGRVYELIRKHDNYRLALSGHTHVAEHYVPVAGKTHFVNGGSVHGHYYGDDPANGWLSRNGFVVMETDRQLRDFRVEYHHWKHGVAMEPASLLLQASTVDPGDE